MDANDPRLTSIRLNAEKFITRLGPGSGLEFDFNKASVEWVDDFIERARLSEGAVTPGLVSVVGSYLGEAILAATDGRWDDDENGNLGIVFSNGNWCYPFGHAQKQFEFGRDSGNSVLGFYEVSIDFVATGKLAP